MKSLSLSQPHAIIMVGIPGSGKSFFASKFAETFHAPYVRTESITAEGVDPKVADRLATHQLEELVKTGASIILEIDVASRTNRTALSRYLKSVGYTSLLVWPQTDVETARQRITRSKQAHHTDFDGEIQRFSPPHESENALVISGKHTYASQAKIVLKRLSAPRAEISSHKQPPARGTIIVR